MLIALFFHMTCQQYIQRFDFCSGESDTKEFQWRVCWSQSEQQGPRRGGKGRLGEMCAGKIKGPMSVLRKLVVVLDNAIK